ncbi:MAG: F0F1-type ATP synthase assembly protein I [Nitrospinales bacterium]|jgi:F0F1-type ATP synthase assembly protein I
MISPVFWVIPPSNKLMSENSGFRQGMQFAFRLGTELTVATIIGGLLGYALDSFFGTKPWGMVVGIVLGSAAGCLAVYQVAMSLTVEEDDTNNDLE